MFGTWQMANGTDSRYTKNTFQGINNNVEWGRGGRAGAKGRVWMAMGIQLL